MLIEISQDILTGGYNWELYDGPDGIDKFNGFELSLGAVFEQIMYYKTMNALDYREAASETGTVPLTQP